MHLNRVDEVITLRARVAELEAALAHETAERQQLAIFVKWFRSVMFWRSKGQMQAGAWPIVKEPTLPLHLQAVRS